VVGGTRESAPNTGELSLRLPIALINTTTDRTGARRIRWVHEDHGNTGKRGLVFDKLAKLCKCPAIVCGSLRLANSSPRAYAAQVFEGNSSVRVLSLSHNSLAEAVVDILREAGFLGPSMSKKPFSRWGAL